ncbi:hypothetical protein PGTUg99_000688 [Puccinia graminis f. sp. tritici]|uniref:Hydrophobin n=1 Tax=Puccinia graminis f. sp. tritici TaxID=56615 RepID=A0A5B0RNQ4_PUCGR|nr:hypothetical protein PGTUg99_030638 [Puccinia graminis f. sp. tritici]KAA1127591.1 hypothetical protein PGTUg99_000688 [Puccinia graminis f. sp. tritici]
MQSLKSLTLLAIVACKLALADEANEPFRCVRRGGESADERVAVCGGVSKTDPNKYDMTLANTPIDKQNVHNCVGTMLDETRCCRKSAFNLKPNVPKGKFNIITVDLSKTTEDANCLSGKPLNAHASQFLLWSRETQ